MSDTDPNAGSDPISEIELQAYADGLLSPDAGVQVRDYLGEKPAEARRVAFYDTLNRGLQSAFGDASADPAALRQVRAVRRGFARHRLRRLSALVCAALVGAAATWTALEFRKDIAEATLDSVAVTAFQEAAPLQAVPADPHRTVPAAALRLGQGYNLTSLGFHIVASAPLQARFGVKLAEYIYTDAAGTPVVLLALPDDRTLQPVSWQARRAGSLRVLSWAGGGMRYALVGHAQTHNLMKAADLLAQLPLPEASNAAQPQCRSTAIMSVSTIASPETRSWS